MSFESIAIIIFLGSFSVAMTILIRKIPVLAQLPEVSYPKKEWRNFLETKVKSLRDYFGKIHYEGFLQKVLSRICVLTLKAERKASYWLQKLREREKNKKIAENDNYWDRFKNKVSRKRGRKTSV